MKNLCFRNSKRIVERPRLLLKKLLHGDGNAVAIRAETADDDEAAMEGHPDNETSGKSSKFMLAGEAAIVMSRACELLIRELTGRAWIHTERNRRRTLQRPDLHAAVGESEVYDFLIDIVPRVTAPRPASAAVDDGSGGIPQIPQAQQTQEYSTMAAVLGEWAATTTTGGVCPDT